jgi:undecaprenyl-diphosphatase
MRFVRILLFFSLIATVVIYLFPRTWELDLIANLQAASTRLSVHFFQFITDYVDVISVGIPVVLLLIGLARQNKSLREKALLILFSVALAGVLSNSIKRVVREPRPYEVDTRIAQWSGGGGYGFPSGHTADAVAAATAFSLLWPELTVIIAVCSWAGIIMFSRIYLGVHDPGDVMAGMFLGILSSLVVIKIRDSLNQRRADAGPK